MPRLQNPNAAESALLERSPPGLSSDVAAYPGDTGGGPHFVLEHTATGCFYRVGQREFAFMGLLDGKRSLGAVLEIFHRRHPQYRLTTAEALAACQWLADRGLTAAGQAAICSAKYQTRKGRRPPPAPRWNLVSQRIALLRPEPLVAAMAPWVGWVFSPWAMLAGGLLIFAAMVQLAVHWSDAAATTREIFPRPDWLLIFLAWLGLKLLHEMGHGIACKRFGGEVREAGVIFVLFFPLAYVDVTSSWRFARSKRILTSAAGIYMELLAAAAAIFVWVGAEEGGLRHFAFTVAITAGVGTVLFNANPLMRFDGYYILSDLAGVANLYQKGQAVARRWGRLLLLGLPCPLPMRRGPGMVLIGIYGILALLWRLVVLVSIILAASLLFSGAGMLLAAAIVLTRLVPPLVKAVRFLGGRNRAGRRWWQVLLLRTGPLAAGLAALLVFVPSPHVRRTPAVIDFAPLTVIRAPCDGFVGEVRAGGGDRIAAGEPLLSIVNRQLDLDVADLSLAMEHSEQQMRLFNQRRELARWKAEQQRLLMLEKEFEAMRKRQQELTVCAPHGGQILTYDLESLLGQYVCEGEALCLVADPARLEARLSIDQRDVQLFAERAGGEIVLSADGRPRLQARLKEVRPRASDRVEHPALAAVNGGPLPVVRQESPPAHADAAYRFLRPRFTGVAVLDAAHAQHVRAGQVAWVQLGASRERLGQWLLRHVTQWLRRKLNQDSHYDE